MILFQSLCEKNGLEYNFRIGIVPLTTMIMHNFVFVFKCEQDHCQQYNPSLTTSKVCVVVLKCERCLSEPRFQHQIHKLCGISKGRSHTRPPHGIKFL